MIYIDGERFTDRKDARISVYDHGLLYGDGIFEGIRIYNNRAFLLKEHIERLYLGAKALNLNIDLSPAEMIDLVNALVTESGKQDGYIRQIVTRGVGDLGINPYLCKKTSLIIIIDDITLYPDEDYKNGIPIISSSSRRISRDTFDPRIKSLNYLNNVLVKMEAIEKGCREAVILNHEGFVAECTGDNIFIIRNGRIFLPPCSDGGLDGITKNLVIKLAEDSGYTVEEKHLTLYDLYTAEEAFLTGTACEIIGVTKIDGRILGSGNEGPVTADLRKAFGEYISKVD